MSEVIIKRLEEMELNVKGEVNSAKAEAKLAAESAEKNSTELKAEFKVVKDEVDKVADQVKEMQAAAGRLRSESKEVKSFADSLGEQLEAKKEDIKGYTKSRNAINLSVKAVGDFASGNLTTSGTETFSGNTMLGVGRKPYEIAHVRDFLNVRAITTDSAYVVRDNAGEGGPTAVAMAAAKPQSDRDYQKLIVPVTKIAHYFKIPEEMLADNAWLQAEIASIGIEELMSKEDDLVLNQVGGAGLFAGLTTATNSTAFSAPASLALGIDLANNYDALVAAWTQLKTLKNTPNYILCNPADYARMILTKESATNGSYVFGAPNVSIPNVFGIPLVPHNSITSDKFLIGDFSKVYLGQREGVSVRFYDQNEDDAIKNMVTIVIEERLTVVADRNDRIVYGDFSDARAALETA